MKPSPKAQSYFPASCIESIISLQRWGHEVTGKGGLGSDGQLGGNSSGCWKSGVHSLELDARPMLPGKQGKGLGA